MFRHDEKLVLNGKTTIVRHRSISDYLTAMEFVKSEEFKSQLYVDATDNDGSGWNGYKSTDEYAEMLRYGWPEGVQTAHGLEGLASDAAERLSFRRDVGGAFPVVPAFLAGAPDAMLMPHNDINENVRGVTLVIDTSFNANVSGDTVLKYAQQVMQLVAWLAAERIETAVYAVDCVNFYETPNTLYVCPVREAGQILQPERIASVIHPGFLRHAWFNMVEVEAMLSKTKGMSCYANSYAAQNSGYGHARHATTEQLAAVLPEAYSVIQLPKPGDGDPTKAVEESVNLKFRHKEY